MLDEKDLQILQSMFHQNEERFKTALVETETNLRGEFKTALAETETNLRGEFKTALAETETNLRSEFKTALAETETNLRGEFKTALAETETNLRGEFKTALAETETSLRGEFGRMLDERISQSENSVLSYVDWTREELEKKLSVLDAKVDQLWQYGNLVKLEYQNSETFLNIALDLQKRVTTLEAKIA